ncbi:dienelactone hydrolase family protein [Pyxidicoccus xibeiensis]|uniref:dienelactone hydrolase family protein n=1 Tax=Pyxidicoccus xibeiensis TaxID=2906759 RepID=UPI0020A6EB45|nr:dienelactone hydrolase family protein [Pyxidicoccus xibeiensis]MCP3144545.1 dienelactone hydrolase family protein [Pyxidicoccus xibeiensis]
MTTRAAAAPRNLEEDDPLEDFQHREVTLLGKTRKVYTAGTGPAVIVMAEMPGISPRVARFARWVRDSGLTAWMPSLFGRDGAVPTAKEGRAVFERACISREFRALGANESSPISAWLRALAAHAHAECGGPGVGAIGMCFTGNFALSMMLEKAVLAPVLSQPSLPLDEPAGVQIAPDELARVRQRLEDEDLTVLAYRFEGDAFCRAERFAAYQRALGERFVARVLPDSAAGPKAARSDDFFRFIPTPHSVLTVHLVDREGEPTAAARDEVLAFFRRRLLA